MQHLLTKQNIQRVLFDLDDTLLETHTTFVEHIDAMKQQLAELANVPVEQIEADFGICEMEARALHYVDPIPLWTTIFQLMALKYPFLDSELQHKFVTTLYDQIYRKPIALKDGAIELLQFLMDLQIPIGIVTNASDEWTWYKLEQAELTRFFNAANVWVIPPHTRKSKEHWEQAISASNIPAENTLVFGDNYKSDIIPTTELGALAVYLHLENNWILHKEGYGEADITRIIEITDLRDFQAAFQNFIENNENLMPPIY